MAISRARKERQKAQQDLKTGNAAQKKKARATIAATTPILQAEKATRGKGLEELRGMRETQMGARETAVGSAAKIEEANIARAYADAMRMITEREKAQGTRYTGPGVQGLMGDQPAIDPGAYTKRYMDPTTTEYQDINLERMLEFAGTIPERRQQFRDLWGDPGSQTYADMQEWQLQQLAGGGAPPPKWLTQEQLNNLNNTNLNNLNLNLKQGTSAFQHPYAADPYTVPHMQTGAGWEGLGAEYQPGTVEGLGLIAGDAYAPYEPLARGLLDAQPAYTPTGGVFNKVGGDYGGQFLGYPNPSGSSSTSSDSWSPTWQFTTVNGGQQYGYFNQGGQWVRGGDQSS